MIAIPVPLNPQEKRMAVHCGTKRHEFGGANCNERIQHDTDKLQNSIDSMGAEIAFCKHANFYPDFEIGFVSKLQGTDKGDVFINGVPCDVKQTKRDNGRLIAFKNCELTQIQVYILVTGTLEAGFIYRGAARKERFINPDNFYQLPGARSATYNLDQADLVDYRKLFKGHNDETQMSLF